MQITMQITILHMNGSLIPTKSPRFHENLYRVCGAPDLLHHRVWSSQVEASQPRSELFFKAKSTDIWGFSGKEIRETHANMIYKKNVGF